MAEDEAVRDLYMARDALVCPSCGNLREVCSDPDVDWHPHMTVCWATATRDWGRRRFHAKHEGREISPDALHPADGVGIYVARSAPAPEDDPLV